VVWSAQKTKDEVLRNAMATEQKSRDFLRLNVDAVVKNWATVEPTADEVDAILEVAYLAIASDGVVTRPEMEAFVMVMERLFGPNLTSDRIAQVLDQYTDSLDHDGYCSRLAALRARLTRQEVRNKAYQLAYSMVMCDLDTNTNEFEFDQVLREHLGLDDDAAEELVDETVDIIMGPRR
jgi:hypothetical protein